MSFPISLKRWRLDKGLKIGEAAELAGVTQPAWSEWENELNLSQRKRSTCAKIAKALDMPLDIVLAAAGYDSLDRDDELAKVIALEEQRVPAHRRNEYRSMVRHLIETTASVMASA